MDELEVLNKFWMREFDEKCSLRALQFYEVLRCLPNEYWKYLVSVYYMYCRDKGKDFFEMKSHEKFLARILTYFLVKLIDKPTVAAVKPLVFNAGVSLYGADKLDFGTRLQEILDKEWHFKERFLGASKTLSTLLTLYTYIKYSEQKIISEREIEHIFPKTHSKSYANFSGDKIESIGNKMWLEKKVNIQAGNKIFIDKKEKYKTSEFLEAQELSKSPNDHWRKEDIIEREDKIFQTLISFFRDNL